MIIVSDSTILIGLVKIEKLDLLKKIFSEIFIPGEVFKEVVERGKGKPGSTVIKEAAWIKAKTVKDKIQVAFLLGSLEKGEAEVLVLAKNLGLIHEVRPLIDELIIKKFRISDKIIEKTLKKAGEA